LRLTENPGPNFKQYALQKGIEVSRGSFLLFTDADCEIPPRWIPGMIARMAILQTGAALGPVFKRPDAKSFFRLYQCFEHGVRYMYLAASTGIGAAGGGFGNNMIVRRESLDAIGGYASVPASPTEDAALVSAIRSRSTYKIRAGMGPDIHIITQGENTWKEFITQTLRWNNGGLFCPDLATRFNYGFLVITISMGILAIPFLPFIPTLWPLTLAVLISMAANTIANLKLFGVSLPKKRVAYIVQCIFTPIYFTFLTILGLCGIRPKWKGQKIKERH
jgi:cellulose synthase/poly-beta-1,6-N-acetylglucosamine synthase-like glycosyltransferase